MVEKIFLLGSEVMLSWPSCWEEGLQCNNGDVMMMSYSDNLWHQEAGSRERYGKGRG